MNWHMILLLVVLQGAAACALAIAVSVWLSRKAASRPCRVLLGGLSEPRSFLFRDGYLVEHSDNVGFLLPEPIDHLHAWDALIDGLSEMVDGAWSAFEDLSREGRSFRLEGQLGRDRLHVVGLREGADLRISVASAGAEERSVPVDLDALRALEAEISLLTLTADSSPTASWLLDGDGCVVWANVAYQEIVSRCHGPDAGQAWPITPIFADPTGPMTGRTRRQIVDGKGAVLWFDVVAGAPDPSGQRQMHAVSLDSVVAAEDSLRNFMQTLTKTFAYLPTGLAIFDRDRRLAMFNPALIDMVGLDGAWLSGRPKLEEFFDALRERRKLPEPRDYKAWRNRLSDLERVDAGGTYRETWTLPTGQTYCVTGRPQANGSVALMFEDVSADISADRAHREERDALTNALSASDEALVVFDALGRRIAANPQACAVLPGAGSGALPETLDEAISTWREAFRPSPAWADLRDAARGDGPATRLVDWTEILHREDGTDLTMRVVPKRGGGLALGFGEAVGKALADPAVAVPAE